MHNSQTSQPEEGTWPAVEPAYDFVVPSYQMLISRFEAADNRLTALVSVVSGLTLGGPAFARAVNQTIAFDSPQFMFALVAAAVAAILGVVGRIQGRLVLPNPTIFYGVLHESPWTFKKNAIYFAGQHFTKNARTIEVKGRYATAVTIVLLIQIWMLTIWFAAS